MCEIRLAAYWVPCASHQVGTQYLYDVIGDVSLDHLVNLFAGFLHCNSAIFLFLNTVILLKNNFISILPSECSNSLPVSGSVNAKILIVNYRALQSPGWCLALIISPIFLQITLPPHFLHPAILDSAVPPSPQASSHLKAFRIGVRFAPCRVL